jgi:hypothetical protein
MKKEEVDKDILELEQLAESTPSRFAVMTITDERTGLTIKVDQSLDSSVRGGGDEMIKITEEFLKIHLHWMNRKYNGEFDGKHKIKINTILIDFGNYEGVIAHRWLMRYVDVMLTLMDKEGKIDLKEIERTFKVREGN